MLRKLAVSMFCPLAIATISTLAVATLAAAEEHHPAGKAAPASRPAFVPHGPPPGAHFAPPAAHVVPGGPPRLHVVPGGPPTVHAVPEGPPGAHAQFVFHGRPYHPIHFARPYIYPAGWGYRRWAVGAFLPALFLGPDYYYTDYAEAGLPPPEPGFEWVQYGPDLLLVNISTGEIVDVAYGVFY